MSDFEKGFENGLENIEKANYEGYLSSEVSLDWLLGNKETLTKDLEETKQKIEETRTEKLEIFKHKQEVLTNFNEQGHLTTQLENDIEAQKLRITEAKEQKNINKSPYPMLAGLIYLAAGITFILGDLIISHEIVAYALNIRNTYEAWAFACGLAGVSILLKPAYERLVEQPYLTQLSLSSKKVHGYFQVVLIVISIGTLSILGWFRYEAYKTDKLKEAINREIKSLQMDATPLIQGGQTVENPVLTQKIEQKLKEYDQLNQKLVNSPWALLSFVLSGVLFAIAGAICLGIAFPVLQVYWKRWFQLNPKENWANRRIRKKTKALNEIKKPWFKGQTMLELADQRLELLPDLEELKARKTKLETEILSLNEKIKLAIESSRVSTYNEGYESGNINRDNLTTEELEKYRKDMLERIQLNQQDANVKSPRTYKSNGLRPHQALRKAITNSFNEN
ncbi:hypothetical protein EGI22_12270 [Lacihabitans sp. LS3-19]|uniref:hypothetical protein n=1 Tax=Lacihabitans sp. LS3-19 TaxID=2487335 RepID=UPI0020CE5469|nr:hypothetical protein [Lacihabitans sp. LS3-19]MCP9768693.1 hypothetical protein [Lacihabitans sp. LS3-19]